MNRRGDITITLVFVGAIMLFTLSYYTIFTISNNQGFDNVQTISRQANFIEEHIRSEANVLLTESKVCLEKELNKNCIQEAAKNKKFYLDGTDFFAKIREGDFELKKEGERIVFNIDNVDIETSYNDNKLQRTVSITSYS